MSLVDNERTKYLATLINTVSAATIVGGVVAPLVALSFGVPGPISGTFAVIVSFAWFLTGAGLHHVVRRVLGRLHP